MNLTLNLDSLLQRGHRVLQELLLLVVLLSNVRVDVAILGLLVLDVCVEDFVDGYF